MKKQPKIYTKPFKKSLKGKHEVRIYTTAEIWELWRKDKISSNRVFVKWEDYEKLKKDIIGSNLIVALSEMGRHRNEDTKIYKWYDILIDALKEDRREMQNEKRKK